MAAYSFDRFCRDQRLANRLTVPFQLSGWLDWDKDSEQATEELNETLDAICAAMSPTERADPPSIGEIRRRELATAANLSVAHLDLLLHIYERVAERHDFDAKPWQEAIALASVWACLPLLFIANGCRLLIQKLRACWRHPKESV